MGPSQSQLSRLSPEDRAVYKQWVRRGIVFYGSVVTLLICAVVANHLVTSASSDVAGDELHTAAISARK
jgi:hypothetical protein